jgi:hypothetical protein
MDVKVVCDRFSFFTHGQGAYQYKYLDPRCNAVMPQRGPCQNNAVRSGQTSHLSVFDSNRYTAPRGVGFNIR